MKVYVAVNVGWAPSALKGSNGHLVCPAVPIGVDYLHAWKTLEGRLRKLSCSFAKNRNLTLSKLCISTYLTILSHVPNHHLSKNHPLNPQSLVDQLKKRATPPKILARTPKLTRFDAPADGTAGLVGAAPPEDAPPELNAPP